MTPFSGARVRRVLPACLMVGAGVLAGCHGTHVPAADTILRFQVRGSGVVPVGFRWVYWQQAEDGVIVLGTGAFPREHEDHTFRAPLFTTAHPWPNYTRRLRITGPSIVAPGQPAECRVQLLVPRGWPQDIRSEQHDAYCGRAALVLERDQRTLSTVFRDLPLTHASQPDLVLTVSGKVVGRAPEAWMSQPPLSEADERFGQDWTQATQR